jgi:SNF2 family DNA or RNA helicase
MVSKFVIITKYNSGLVRYQPSSKAENKLLRAFPGLIDIGLDRFSTTKPHVVSNIVARLKRKKVPLQVDQYVKDCVDKIFSIAELPDNFKFITEPLHHQKIALRFLYTLKSGGLLLEAGMGKTKIVLDYIALMEFTKSLIIAPKALLFVWEDERLTHRPDKTMYVVDSTDWVKELPGILAADITVINYNKAVILEEHLKTIPWDYINLDEFLIKNPTTQRTQAVTRIGEKVKYKTGGSGTLVNNTPEDVFAPIRFVEPSLVGNSFHKFKNEYAVTRVITSVDESKTMRFTAGYKQIPEIKAILDSCSIIMTKKEWLKGLPEKIFKDIVVLMSDAQRILYEELASNYIAEINGKTLEVDNPLTLLCKLMQISNGFLYLHSPPEELEWIGEKVSKKNVGKKETITFSEQPKAEKLIEMLTGHLINRRVIIWYNLSNERKIIESYLNAAQISFLTIAGGEKDTGGKVKEFNRNQKYTVLLCQAKSVNYGITVLGTNPEALEEEGIEILPDVDTAVYTQIFYSLSFSLETYLQQQDRNHRIGQTHTCEYYHLISNSPVEKDIIKALGSKMELRTTLLTDIVKAYHDLLLSQRAPSEKESTD